MNKELTYFKQVADSFTVDYEMMAQNRSRILTIPTENFVNIARYVKDRVTYLEVIMKELTETIINSNNNDNLDENSMGVYAEILQELYNYMMTVVNKSAN